jgi:hypothetical protein
MNAALLGTKTSCWSRVLLYAQPSPVHQHRYTFSFDTRPNLLAYHKKNFYYHKVPRVKFLITTIRLAIGQSTRRPTVDSKVDDQFDAEMAECIDGFRGAYLLVNERKLLEPAN